MTVDDETSPTKSVASESSSHGVINPVTQSAQYITINPATQLPIKLTGSNNYLTWKAQHDLLFLNYDLTSYINGTSPCPPATDPERKAWLRQDGLIWHAIMASVDLTIAPLVATAPTDHAAWLKLARQYANKSQSRVYGLQNSLARLTKGTKPIAQYFNEIRVIVDELASVDSPISDSALVIKILSGLGPEYNDISVSIRSRDTPISLEELFDKLSGHEIFLLHRQETLAVTAQYNQRSNNQNRNQQHSYGNNNNRRNSSSFSNGNNNRHSSNGNRQSNWCLSISNNNNNNNNNRPRVQCQLCEKFGHIAR